MKPDTQNKQTKSNRNNEKTAVIQHVTCFSVFDHQGFHQTFVPGMGGNF